MYINDDIYIYDRDQHAFSCTFAMVEKCLNLKAEVSKNFRETLQMLLH